MDLDEKQRRFCALVAGGIDAPEAYLQAGFSCPAGIRAKVEAEFLLEKKFIQDEIAQVRKKLGLDKPEPVAEETDLVEYDVDPEARFSKQWLLDEFHRVYEKTKIGDKKDLTAANRCLESIAKLTKAYDKVEFNPDEYLKQLLNAKPEDLKYIIEQIRIKLGTDPTDRRTIDRTRRVPFTKPRRMQI